MTSPKTTSDLEPAETTRGWLPPREASAFLASKVGVKIAPRTIQSWCHRRTGALPHVRTGGGRILLRIDQLLDYINRGALAPASEKPE